MAGWLPSWRVPFGNRAFLLGLLVIVGLGPVSAGLVAALTTTPGRASWVDPSAGAGAGPSAQATAESTPPATARRATLAPPADPASVKVAGARLFGWALMDRHTGHISGSANSAKARNTVESMIKPWLAADYLRRLSTSGRQPSQQVLTELRLMIVDSNDPMAEKYYQLGGADSVIRRLIQICGLTSVVIKPTLWSWTEMTPQDAVKYGGCLGDGRAAGAQWTAWLLQTMTEVRGGVDDQVSRYVQGGRWGIIDALPSELADETSIKNGWTLYRNGWHVNCLAVHPGWVLVVMLVMPRGLSAAADACESVAARLVVLPG